MSAPIQEYSYVGCGAVKLKLADADPVPVGNCSALSLKMSVDEKTLTDYTNGGGGTWNKMTRIKDVSIEMDLRELSPANIGLALNGTVIVDDATGKATIEALTAMGKEYTLIFEGMNDAQSGASVDVTVHRFKPTPAESLDLIGDDFATLKIKGSALVDKTQPAGKSRYFVVVMDTKV